MSGGDDITEQKDHEQYDEDENDSLTDEIKKKYHRIQRQAPRY
jgi:hypothetical protein